ncbi:hypothetical protein [Nocardioides sp.]|uniref:hypothetical protein n=1 Tax=Nocardioides sp. TaxID=35761 RepID=UPI0031FEF9CD|nr:hypothetical protein [Nocardioides sp.]
MTPQRWWPRVAFAGVLFVALEVLFVQVQFEPDFLRLLLLVALGVALVGLVLDSLPDVAPLWQVRAVRPSTPPGQDHRTSLNLRIIEGHLTGRTPDAALRDRLAALAEQVLRVRHDVGRDEARAVELLGPELYRVLTEPPRRLSRAEIERCVQRIEEL